ncbi:MAG: hypothetical protein ABIN18_17205 [Pseudomonadota bacterium]
MRKLIDLTGKRFGRLLVIERADNNKWGHTQWKCRCDCGEIAVVSMGSLRNGRTKSCGCLQKEKVRECVVTHNMARMPIYRIWQDMKNRCMNPNCKGYDYYGGRGIKVCERWMDFNNFYADLGDRPEGKSIERIKNNLGYFPLNVCWASPEQQNQNQRTTKLTPKKVRQIRFLGKTKTQRAIAKIFGVGSTAIHKVLHNESWANI